MKKADLINYSNILNNYIATAKNAVIKEQAIARENTLYLIANLAALSIFMIKNKDNAIYDKSFSLNEKKLKSYIKKYVYEDDATRSDYMRITAAVYVANKVNNIITMNDDICAACDKFTQAYASVNDLYVESGAKKASGGAGKRKEEQKTSAVALDTDTGAESGSTTEATSSKTTYQKVAESFTNLNKLLTKVEKSDLTPDFVKLVESNIGELDKVVQVVIAKSKLNYKSSKKAA